MTSTDRTIVPRWAHALAALRATALLLGGGTMAAAAFAGASGGQESAGPALVVGFIAATLLWKGLPLGLDLLGGPIAYEGVVLAVRPESSLRPRRLVAEVSVAATGSAVRRNATLPPAAVTRVAVGSRLCVRALPRSGTVLSLDLLDP